MARQRGPLKGIEGGKGKSGDDDTSLLATMKPGEPEMPNVVSSDKIAREEWARVVPLLMDDQILAKTDMSTLSAYCLLFARWVRAEALIQRDGLIVIARNGSPSRNPAVPIAKDALGQMIVYASEFGLSPVARTRISKATGGHGKGVGRNSPAGIPSKPKP